VLELNAYAQANILVVGSSTISNEQDGFMRTGFPYRLAEIGAEHAE